MLSACTGIELPVAGVARIQVIEASLETTHLGTAHGERDGTQCEDLSRHQGFESGWDFFQPEIR